MPLLAQQFEIVRPAGQHFVRIALMPDVKQQPVRAGGIGAKIIDVMQGDGQLDHAEIGGQMPAVFADRGENLLAHFVGEQFQLFD